MRKSWLISKFACFDILLEQQETLRSTLSSLTASAVLISFFALLRRTAAQRNVECTYFVCKFRGFRDIAAGGT